MVTLPADDSQAKAAVWRAIARMARILTSADSDPDVQAAIEDANAHLAAWNARR